MKIIKPLTLGVLHQPYRFQGQHRLSIAALGFFALGRSDERFLVDNLQWPRVLPQLPAGQPLDHVLPKAHAEVMLCGAAHAPKPVEAMHVRLQCGPVDKRLRVIGDRRWDRTWTRCESQRRAAAPRHFAIWSAIFSTACRPRRAPLGSMER